MCLDFLFRACQAATAFLVQKLFGDAEGETFKQLLILLVSSHNFVFRSAGDVNVAKAKRHVCQANPT